MFFKLYDNFKKKSQLSDNIFVPFIAQFVCLNQTITYKGVRVKKLTAHSLTVKLLSIGRMPVGQKGGNKVHQKGEKHKKDNKGSKKR